MKLNLGSGPKPIEGWENYDHNNGHKIYPLALPDNSADVIRCSHALEHFEEKKTLAILLEWVRVLKPGGWLKIAVPDFDWIVKEYADGNTKGLPLFGYLMGGQTDENDYHKAVFNEGALKHWLTSAGLTDIQSWQSEVDDCAALPVSLNLMGRKPVASLPVPTNAKQFVAGEWRDEATLAKDKVAVRPGIVMSTPRYGPLDSAECIFDIAAALQAPRFKSTGCWRSQRRTRAVETALDYRSEGKQEWEEGLTDAIEDALEYKANDASIDVLISVDYDTFATPDDAKELIKLLYQNPQYDCVVPMQVRRGTFEEVLATTAGPVDFAQALVPIVSGHFGLTVFRRRVFEQMSRPWFLSKPDADGRWGDGRTDADIYFWQRFNDQGFKAALATQVVIGHGDEVVCWPKFENGKIVKVYQPLYAWHATRKSPCQLNQLSNLITSKG